MKRNGFLIVVLLASSVFAHAAGLTTSTFTEVIREVNVLGNRPRAAELNGLFEAPERAQTGVDSRAELTAPDKTITRIGATTVFSFRQNGSEVNLDKGSILFNSPTGKGKRTIRSAGASAGILGTTLLVAATADGGFKVILLEGRGRVTLPSGRSQTLRAGQMAYIVPGQDTFGPVLDINLGNLVSGSTLVNGFSTVLPSMPKIQKEIDTQRKQIASGRISDTGIDVSQLLQRPNFPKVDEISYTISTAPAREAALPPPKPPPRPPKPPGQNPGR